jgi:hypothetical protein
MITITLRLLLGSAPFELDAPYTAEHLREEVSTGAGIKDGWIVCEAKGVEYVSLYDADGRCLLDDDIVREDEEYMVFIHTVPIQRYYLEDTDEVLELEIGDPTVDHVYDVLVEALWEKEEEEEETEERYLFLSLRIGGMNLLGWDESESLTGREIAVQWRVHEHPSEWE